jgi:hypothetical protein
MNQFCKIKAFNLGLIYIIITLFIPPPRGGIREPEHREEEEAEEKICGYGYAKAG